MARSEPRESLAFWGGASLCGAGCIVASLAVGWLGVATVWSVSVVMFVAAAAWRQR